MTALICLNQVLVRESLIALAMVAIVRIRPPVEVNIYSDSVQEISGMSFSQQLAIVPPVLYLFGTGRIGLIGMAGHKAI